MAQTFDPDRLELRRRATATGGARPHQRARRRQRRLGRILSLRHWRAGVPDGAAEPNPADVVRPVGQTARESRAIRQTTSMWRCRRTGNARQPASCILRPARATSGSSTCCVGCVNHSPPDLLTTSRRSGHRVATRSSSAARARAVSICTRERQKDASSGWTPAPPVSASSPRTGRPTARRSCISAAGASSAGAT